jgi:UDP-2,4-diacetamido-2,4,6-trideoxy-beta-L-altropyranose hydrolase
MKHSIFFRVDGGPTIGLGHLVRSMALADMLKDDYAITFASKEAPDSIIDTIIKAGFEFIKIAAEDDFFKTLHNAIVVLDGYGFDKEYQLRLRGLGCKVACIDDLHDKPFAADIIINHLPDAKPEDYDALPDTQFALGLGYALLRPAFLEAAKKSRIKQNHLRNVFICFGGADPSNLTLKALKAVVSFESFSNISVVTGASYMHIETLQELVLSDNRIYLHSDVSEEQMCTLMEESDLAIIPSSSILLEAIACGLEVITCYYVDNQERFHEAITKRGIVSAGLADGSYDKKLVDLISKYSTENISEAIRKEFLGIRSRYNSKFNEFKDGSQSVSVDEIDLKIATSEDTAITFTWASDPAIRAYSFNASPITKEVHEEWFILKVKDPKCIYFIARYKNIPVGSIRYDLIGNEAILSFLVSSNFQKMGIGKILLIKGFDAMRKNPWGVKKIVGYVMKSNIPSMKSFCATGYMLEDIGEEKVKFIKKYDEQVI